MSLTRAKYKSLCSAFVNGNMETMRKGNQERHGAFIGGIEDVLQSAAYSFAQEPIDGVEQLLRHAHVPVPHVQLVAAPVDDNWETRTGYFAGKIGQALVIATGVGAAFEGLGVAGELATLPKIASSALRGAANGMIYGALAPTTEDNHYWRAKAELFGISTLSGAALNPLRQPVKRMLGGNFSAEIGARITASALFAPATKVLAEDVVNLQPPSRNQVADMVPLTLHGITRR